MKSDELWTQSHERLGVTSDSIVISFVFNHWQ